MKYIIPLMLIGAVGVCAAQTPVFKRPKVIERQGYIPREVYPTLDASRNLLDVNLLHDGVNVNGDIIPFTGKGVLIGIIDGGIDPLHLAFRRRDDLTKSRIQLALRTKSAVETGGDNVEYEAHYAPDGELAPKTFKDFAVEGHGIHTTGCAAGGYEPNGYYGMAPDATIMTTSMGDNFYDDEVLFGISATLDYARMKGMPVVASLSLGSVVGPHNGYGRVKDLLDEKLDESGQVVCFAAGNDARMACHLTRNFAETPGEMATAFYGYNNGSYASATTYSELFTDSRDWEIAFTVIDYGDVRREVARSEWISAETLLDRSWYEVASNWSELADYFDNTYIYVSAIEPEYHRNGFDIQTQIEVRSGDTYALGMVVRSESADVEIITEPSLAQLYNFGLDSYVTGNNRDCISDMATADHVVSVGAFNHRESYVDGQGRTHRLNTDVYGEVGSMASYSSFTDKCGGLPLVAAPGTDVISSITSSSSYERVDNAYAPEGSRFHWGACSGTSMATPVMAGVIALWLQANPQLTYDQLLDVMEHCSTPVEPAYKARYGLPSAYEGLKYILGISAVSEITDNTPRELMMRPMGNGEWEAVVPFATEGGNYNVWNMAGTRCVAGSFSGGVFNVTLPEADGIYIIEVTTAQGRVTQKLRR